MLNSSLATMNSASQSIDYRKIFARNLRKYRRFIEKSQESLALDAEMSRSYLNGVELGKRNISIDNMGALAQALKVPLKDLLDLNLFDDVDAEKAE